MKKLKYVLRVIWWLYGWFAICLSVYVIVDMIINRKSVVTTKIVAFIFIAVFFVLYFAAGYVGKRDQYLKERAHHLDGDPESF
jgi:hypothetical protein